MSKLNHPECNLAGCGVAWLHVHADPETFRKAKTAGAQTLLSTSGEYLVRAYDPFKGQHEQTQSSNPQQPSK